MSQAELPAREGIFGNEAGIFVWDAIELLDGDLLQHPNFNHGLAATTLKLSRLEITGSSPIQIFPDEVHFLAPKGRVVVGFRNMHSYAGFPPIRRKNSEVGSWTIVRTVSFFRRDFTGEIETPTSSLELVTHYYQDRKGHKSFDVGSVVVDGNEVDPHEAESSVRETLSTLLPPVILM